MQITLPDSVPSPVAGPVPAVPGPAIPAVAVARWNSTIPVTKLAERTTAGHVQLVISGSSIGAGHGSLVDAVAAARTLTDASEQGVGIFRTTTGSFDLRPLASRDFSHWQITYLDERPPQVPQAGDGVPRPWTPATSNVEAMAFSTIWQPAAAAVDGATLVGLAGAGVVLTHDGRAFRRVPS